MAILFDHDNDTNAYDKVYTEDKDSESEIKDAAAGSEGYESDSDTAIKSDRSVSPTPYVPQFPNLPSGLAWHARQKALRTTSPETPTVPKQKRPPVSRKLVKKAAVSEMEKSIPTRYSARNKNESALSHSAPRGELIESTFTLKKGQSFRHLHIFTT